MGKITLHLVAVSLLISAFIVVTDVSAATITTSGTATTTINLSICGNSLVDQGEQCDVPGEIGLYSTTIVGRQCNATCKFGPYCGDGILQSSHTEECDDGNNTNGDFCSAICKIEPAGSGGGGSSGGNSGGGGGSATPVGDTIVSVSGIAYPSQTINFLLDTKTVGSVRTNSNGQFTFSTVAAPGTATLGIWANDSAGHRSITLNHTFDVTHGAVTNVSGLILPPTIFVANPNIIPGSTISITGQSIPNASVEIHFNDSEVVVTAPSDTDGQYKLDVDTHQFKIAQYTIKARSVTGVTPLFTQSSYSSSLQLFIGVDGKTTSPSDLNRDGKIDLIDFSILIFWWQTAGGDSDPPADISGNGRVGLEDFSILLFNWTG